MKGGSCDEVGCSSGVMVTEVEKVETVTALPCRHESCISLSLLI